MLTLEDELYVLQDLLDDDEYLAQIDADEMYKLLKRVSNFFDRITPHVVQTLKHIKVKND